MNFYTAMHSKSVGPIMHRRLFLAFLERPRGLEALDSFSSRLMTQSILGLHLTSDHCYGCSCFSRRYSKAEKWGTCWSLTYPWRQHLGVKGAPVVFSVCAHIKHAECKWGVHTRGQLTPLSWVLQWWIHLLIDPSLWAWTGFHSMIRQLLLLFCSWHFSVTVPFASVVISYLWTLLPVQSQRLAVVD